MTRELRSARKKLPELLPCAFSRYSIINHSRNKKSLFPSQIVVSAFEVCSAPPRATRWETSTWGSSFIDGFFISGISLNRLLKEVRATMLLLL